MENLKLQPPVENFVWQGNLAQGFGMSRDIYFSKFGIPGHNGIDITLGLNNQGITYGANVLAAHEGLVVGISLDHSRSRGMGIVLQKILNDGTIAQTIYWHLSEVLVSFGQTVSVGQIIGKIGNTGFVFPEPSDSCPYCGAHLHFGLLLFKNGKPVFIDYINAVNPIPFMFNIGDKLPMQLSRDLFWGCSGDDVSWLQTCLQLEGYAKDYLPIGQFGSKTKRDVSLLQQKLGINPTLGYVGTKTRKYLNSKYNY